MATWVLSGVARLAGLAGRGPWLLKRVLNCEPAYDRLPFFTRRLREDAGLLLDADRSRSVGLGEETAVRT